MHITGKLVTNLNSLKASPITLRRKTSCTKSCIVENELIFAQEIHNQSSLRFSQRGGTTSNNMAFIDSASEVVDMDGQVYWLTV